MLILNNNGKLYQNNPTKDIPIINNIIMTNPEESNRTNLYRLIETNRNISHIRDLAFHIKIKSLNEQILAIRNDLGETGFQIVSRDFILFSKSFEELADEMQTLMDKMLFDVAHKLKKEKLFKHRNLAEKIAKRRLSHNNLQQDTEEIYISYEVPNEIKLKKIINRALLLSLKGNNIFIQSKITGAYIKNNDKNSLLNTLISELGEVMEKVRISITGIKKVWS